MLSLRVDLHHISQGHPDCVLLSSDGEHVNTQQLLLAAASSFLASLLAQGGTNTTISLPFTSKVVRTILEVLGEVEEVPIETEIFLAARELGIMFLNEKVVNSEVKDNLGKKVDTIEQEKTMLKHIYVPVCDKPDVEKKDDSIESERADLIDRYCREFKDNATEDKILDQDMKHAGAKLSKARASYIKLNKNNPNVMRSKFELKKCGSKTILVPKTHSRPKAF